MNIHSLVSRDRAGILTLDRSRFDDACAELMEYVMRDHRPDALVGIRTGGLFVAESMAKAVDSPLPVLSITCRRPSTSLKPKSAGIKKLVARLPLPVLDRLRLIEHAILTRKGAQVQREHFQFDDQELAALDRWMAASGPQPSLVVVDDSVDTGNTLVAVLDAVKRHVPRGSHVASAVITVTTERPLVAPDYTLYRDQLCRFPWSIDALTETKWSS